jgi:MFS family permease
MRPPPLSRVRDWTGWRGIVKSKIIPASEHPGMSDKSFWQSGHRPTLIMAFLYFDVAFMVWNLLGPLAPIFSKAMGLTPAKRALSWRCPRWRARAAPGQRVPVRSHRAKAHRHHQPGDRDRGLLAAGSWDCSMNGLIALGVVLGFAGASFAVALPLAGRWYPPQHQGKAMGIAGMGNSGTVLAALFAPLLAKAFGWQNVLALATIPAALVLVAFIALAKDSPNQPRQAAGPIYRGLFQDAGRGRWWFILFYGVTFGGFVGLSGSLPSWYTTELDFRRSCGLCHGGLCVCRIAGAAHGRRAGRPHRRHQDALRRLCAGRRAAGRDRHCADQVCRDVPAVLLRDGHAGRGQWRGVPTGAAAVSP